MQPARETLQQCCLPAISHLNSLPQRQLLKGLTSVALKTRTDLATHAAIPPTRATPYHPSKLQT
jgi:hypothetical protein